MKGYPARLNSPGRATYIFGRTLIISLVALLSVAAPAAECAFGPHPLLFLSERKDLHIGSKRAHANFLKVRQAEQYLYGMRTADGDELFGASEFYAKLDKAHHDAADAPIVVFVHGCCVSFGEQMLQANDLEKAIDKASRDAQAEKGPGAAEGNRPITLSYDWAAPFSYNSSLSNCYVAQSRFNSFMDDLIKRYGSNNIILVGHSLGTLMLQNYAARLNDDASRADLPPFKAIVFSRADVDRAAFADCLPALKKFSQRFIVLSSSNDPNIYFSGMLRRVGVRFAQAATLPTKLPMPIGKGKKADEDEREPHDDRDDQDKKPARAEGLADASTVDAEHPAIPKKLYQRLGQTKVARNFASSVEVYDMSSLRMGHGIPYKFVGDLLFHDLKDFEMKKGTNGLFIVHSARP